MRLLSFALTAGALTSLSFVVAQNAGGDKLTPPAPNTPVGAAQTSLDAKLASMQGLWRLTELRSLRADQSRRSEVGYLLVSGLCFSLELHWGWTSQDGGTRFVSKDFQSGTHRFELDDAGYLDSRSLIGSAFNRDGLLQWEEPGRARRYKIDFLGESMKWSNDDGTTLTFEHMPEPRTARRDVFGRPIPEKKPKPETPKPGEKQDE